MLSRREVLKSSVCATLAAPLFSSGGLAQADWPNREIHSICVWPPGGGADALARFYARKVQALLGKPVIVENKPGASGNIGTEYVARAKPDGYTYNVASGNLLAIAPHVFRQLSYHPLDDFEHVATVFKAPLLLIVPPDSPYKTVAELVEDLKKKGDKGSYASTSNTGVIASELLKQQFGLATVEVKYKGPADAIAEMNTGATSFLFIEPASVLAQIQAGRLKALMVTTPERMKALKDLPSSFEAGLAHMDLFAWGSVIMPKGVPEPIQDKMAKAFNAIAEDPEAIKFLNDLGYDPMRGNAKLARQLIADGIKTWGDYVKLAKIEPFS